VTGLCCHRRQRDAKKNSRHHRQLDASVGASEPHDFAVRNLVVRPRAKRAPTWPASTASRLNVRDDHDTPSFEAGRGKQRTDLRWMIREIFFCRGLDSPNQFESAR
jgi:hypothetical protein